ncbi:MAG: DotU family type IV/VI secretion system protein [Gammaproteobacteria bacterium]|nr:DotU family type IV/VI secretion system protein [Gammaproteobacteria bacterium]
MLDIANNSNRLLTSSANEVSNALASELISANNQLVRIVTPLITLITQIRHAVSHPNVAMLRAQVIEEIKTIEHKLAAVHYPLRTIIATRYCLCAAIDESILSQDWGTQSVWIANSLLNMFQKETWGGERFYVILEDALRDARNNIDFIEFIYFLLSLGFEGRYYGDEFRGMREEIRNRIFYHIRHARMKPERNLSRHAKNSEAPANQQQRKIILKRMWIASSLVIVILAIFYNSRVYHLASPTMKQLNQMATVAPNVIFGQVIERPIVLRDDDGGEQ